MIKLICLLDYYFINIKFLNFYNINKYNQYYLIIMMLKIILIMLTMVHCAVEIFVSSFVALTFFEVNKPEKIKFS